MCDIKEETKFLAALSVFRELYNDRRDVYDVIAKFLTETLVLHSKRFFTLSEISDLLNETFDFKIPEVVIGTSLNRLNLRKEHGLYYVDDMARLRKSRSEKLQELNLSTSEVLFNDLFRFIEEEKQTKLSDHEKEKIVRSLCSFVLNDNNISDYYEYISGYIIKNKERSDFTSSLNKIREGVILYSGINYSDLSEIGSWKTELTIFLDTEILFNSAGFNGSLYQTYFNDFYNYVNEINSKSKRVIIGLKYFNDVRREIEQFFRTAERIVEGIEVLLPNKVAMSSVTDHCKTRSDVIDKKTEFFVSLKNKNIGECEGKQYYAPENHKYNIIDTSVIDSISADLKADVTEKLPFINFVNIDRHGEEITNFEDSRFILLTGDNLTLKIANHPKIKPNGCVPLAVNLNWIINRFWFKLNKGFGDGKLPESFRIISSAQIALSSIINRSIGKQFLELQDKYKQGEVTEEIVKYTVLELRSQVSKPEDIQSDEISQILGNLSDSSLDEFALTLEHERKNSLDKSNEIKDLKDDLDYTREIAKKSRRELKEALDKLIHIKERDKELCKIEINKLMEQKSLADKMAEDDFVRFKLIGIVMIIILLIVNTVIFVKVGTNLVSYITSLASIIAFLFYVSSGKPLKLDLVKFIDKRKAQFLEARYKQFHIDMAVVEVKQKEYDSLESEIQELMTHLDKEG